MQRVQGLLGWVDRVQQRSRWLGFPLAVMGKFRDDHGGSLTTVIAYNVVAARWLWPRSLLQPRFANAEPAPVDLANPQQYRP